MNLAPIVDRIRAQCPAFKVVGGIAELDAALQASAPAMPACYVSPMDEQVTETLGANYTLQSVEIEFGVLIAVRNAKSSAGAESLADLDTLRQSLRAALLNHTPSGAMQPIRFTRGALIDFQPGLMWWQDGYKTAHHIRST